VVYVNYGQASDYRYLETQGVNFTGTIALIRQDSSGIGGSGHGGLAAGTQVALAEQHGCSGALIYADPGDEDGPARKWNARGEPEQAYPAGPWRPPTSVPQASVMNMAYMVGDPWSPGSPTRNTSSSTPPNDNDDRKTAYSLPSIPSLPLSWQQAIPLLQLTYGQGVQANVNWIGGDHANHTIDFSSGPSLATVQLVNINSYKVKPINNVIARILGQKEPTKAIVVGCQRDAWSSSGVVESASSSAIMVSQRSVIRMLILMNRTF
jgi:N-acetylated-alpha-linked acidic dipeptidase